MLRAERLEAMNLFSEEGRRNPYPLYEELRQAAPVLHVPAFDAWLVLDYADVKRVLSDPDAFSSKLGPRWMIFSDPPRHTKLRALVSRAFSSQVVTSLEGRIRQLSRGLLDAMSPRGEVDLAADFSIPLPMMVIAEMLGVADTDRPRLKRWSDAALGISLDLLGNADGTRALQEFAAATAEMDVHLAAQIEQRRSKPHDDLLARLIEAEVDGERLSREEILGFFQLLLVGGQETTTHLINNAMLAFLEHSSELARLRSAPELLPAAIEEVLRHRSPFQWTPRVTRRDTELSGSRIPAGKRVLAMLGAANRDPKQFRDPKRFDAARDPNSHLAFGHGIHFCLGAQLARAEARIALGELLERWKSFERVSDAPWTPGKAIHVLGPARLPIRFEPADRVGAERMA
jgi:cytochrome P450